MKHRMLIYVLLFSCCTPGKKLAIHYTLENTWLRFDTANKKFIFVERGELSFHRYTEGAYVRDRQWLYLTYNPLDSCITYTITKMNADKKVMISCDNYDPRLSVLLNIDGKTYNIKGDSLTLHYPSGSPGKMLINIAFPKYNNSSCYLKRDTLTSTIRFNATDWAKNGNHFRFRINYNYFNWAPLSDTLVIINKNTLKSSQTGDVYKKDKEAEDELYINYLSRCMMPYLKPS